MKKMNRKWMLTILLCMLSVFLAVPSYQVQAASAKKKALKAYSKMLSKKKIKRDSATIYKGKNCYFAIAYIDNNKVPELIIYNTKDVSHMQGWGALYTFRNGKVKYVSQLTLDNVKRLGYYEKTGWFMDNGTWQGYGGDDIMKLNKGKISNKLIYSRETYDDGYTVTIEGYSITNNGTYTQVDATTFNRSLSYNTKNKKFKKYKFYKNTKANRRKYLK